MHSLSLIPHLNNLIFFFRGKYIKKYISGSREQCSFCCWRSGIVEVRCTLILKTGHETQNCPPPVLVSIFCFFSPSLNIFLLLLHSIYVLPLACLFHSCCHKGMRRNILFGQQGSLWEYPSLMYWLSCPPLSTSLFLPFSFKKVL